jgi:hypothetical protein
MFSAVLIWSIEQGTGKTFIGDVMRDIYGRNASVITSVDLHDDSMVWLRNRQFILGEEVSQRRSKSDAGILKHIITGDVVRVNEKYVPHFELPNCANLMFTSNKNDAIILDRGDRRFFVGKLDTFRPIKFWRQLDKWRHKDGGPSAFMHYLLNRVDCTNFDPYAPPLMTMEKQQMQDAGLTGVEQWVGDLLTDPESVVASVFDRQTAKATMKRDLFSVENVMQWLPDDLKMTSRVALANAMVRMGAVRNSSAVRLPTQGKQVKLFALKNQEFWKDKVGLNTIWAANYEKKMTPIKVKKQDKRRRH